MKDLNSHLEEIVYLAGEAMAVDDEAVKRQALADISCAIASVLPVDCAARSAARTFPDRHVVKNGIGYADGYVYSVERQGRKLVGVVDYVEQEWRGYVYEGEKIILEVSSGGKGKSFVTNAMRSAMHESIVYLTHMRRYRRNRKAKRTAAALPPEVELAATVARQESDDELALRLENA